MIWYLSDAESRQFRKGTTVLQHISNRPRFPSAGDNLQFGYNNPNEDGQFDIFNNHQHPSFGQISGGRLPSVDEIKKINQPNKLLTSDLGQNPNNYGSGGHIIDGSRKRWAWYFYSSEICLKHVFQSANE